MFALNFEFSLWPHDTNIIPSQYVCLSTSNPAYISMQVIQYLTI